MTTPKFNFTRLTPRLFSVAMLAVLVLVVGMSNAAAQGTKGGKVGKIGVNLTLSPRATAYASLTVGGVSGLYTINLSTGAATLIGTIGGGSVVRDIAIADGSDTAFGVTAAGNLISFNVATPGTVSTVGAITGLQGGETIAGMDFRPAGGALFAVGSTGRIYSINTTTAAATQVGTGTALSGTDFGVDFNPTVDRIRFISNTGQNLRFNPNNGAVAGTDTNLTYSGGGTPNAVAAAYTNNFAGSTTTTLYAIDATTDSLYIQGGLNGTPSPNLGVLNLVGALGVNTDNNAGFDVSNPLPSGVANSPYAGRTLSSPNAVGATTFTIAQGGLPPGLTLSSAGVISGTPTQAGVFQFTVRVTDSDPSGANTGTQVYNLVVTGTVGVTAQVAYASLTPAGGGQSSLYTVNLRTGAATVIGAIGGGEPLLDIAAPLTASRTLIGLTFGGNRLVSFAAATPGTLTNSVLISGLQPGETIVGIDIRPATGELFGVGNTSRIYLINPSSGAATAVSGTPFTPVINGTKFGVDFNPVPDRIRFVSNNAQQNLRLNQLTGTVAATDTQPLTYSATDVNSGTPSIVSVAYSNNNAGTPVTTLYGIDSARDVLTIQGSLNSAPVSPNSGIQTTIGSLGFDTSDLVGFDITTNAVSDGAVGIPYPATQLAGTGGNAPYTFAVTAGSLPGGLSLSAAGLLTGTPNAVGTFNFTVTATDSSNVAGGQAYVITVTGNPVNVNSVVTLTTTGQALTGTTCPGGSGYSNEYNINANLVNVGTVALNSPFFVVAELAEAGGAPPATPFRLKTANDFVNNCSAGGLVGSQQVIPGPIAPSQLVPVNFQIAMPAVRRFRFLVNVFATTSSGARNASPKKLGMMAMEVTGFDKEGNPVLSATFVPEKGAPSTLNVTDVKVTLVRK